MSNQLERKLSEFVTNGLHLSDHERLVFIIGESPSRSARSPKLWNAAFKECGVDGRMFPLDLELASLRPVLGIIEEDPRVVGVAIAAPYKSQVLEYVGKNVSEVVRKSNSANVLVKSPEGKFFGHNSDGLGAVESIKETFGPFGARRLLVLGCGATGRSVIAAALEMVAADQIIVAVRNTIHFSWLDSIGVRGVQWSSLDSVLTKVQLVVNCTSIGWGSQEGVSPLKDSQVAALQTGAGIFDVVYQPATTCLLTQAARFDIQSIGGSRMNFYQAVIGFMLVNQGIEHRNVKAAMERVTT